jgi:ubiquinone/menaquinone biosynthesis C-methylase UbiE
MSAPRGATVTSDQELFAKGLATYQKVVAANYMAHEQVYSVLHEVLLREAKDGFVFADLACGTAPFSAVALAGARVARYIGIDISEPSLNLAKGALSSLACPVELRCQDFVAAIETWEGPLDVVWIGQSLHHLRASEKRAFMRKVERLLPRDGLFVIWEPTCLESEDRDGWMERFRQMRTQWSAISDEEFAAFESHARLTTPKLRRHGKGWLAKLVLSKLTNFSLANNSWRASTYFDIDRLTTCLWRDAAP